MDFPRLILCSLFGAFLCGAPTHAVPKSPNFILILSDDQSWVGSSVLMDPGKVKAPDQNTPLRSGKGHVYEGGLRVPFTISGPGIKAGAVAQVPVSGVDLLPTITDFSGKKLKLANPDGGSLKFLLLDESELVNRQNDFLVFHQAVTRRPQSAIRQGDYKLVKTWDENKIELFDLSKDLSETKDLSQTFPEKTEELHELLATDLEKVNATTKYMGSKNEIYSLWKK